MGLTGLSQLPQTVRHVLARGEEPLAWQPVDLALGESRIGRTEPPRSIEGLDLNPVSAIASGPVVVDPGLFERWVGGVMLTGHVASTAASLGHALQQTGNARLAVTTERLVLFDEGATTFGNDPSTGLKTWDADTTEVWSLSRAAVSTATLRPRPLMVGRLVIRFEDSSSVALLCGMFSPWGARRLRDAIQAPRKG